MNYFYFYCSFFVVLYSLLLLFGVFVLFTLTGSIKPRLKSLLSFPLFERPRRKPSEFPRFREISRNNRVLQDEIYVPEKKAEVIKSAGKALWEITKDLVTQVPAPP